MEQFAQEVVTEELFNTIVERNRYRDELVELKSALRDLFVRDSDGSIYFTGQVWDDVAEEYPIFELVIDG